MSNGNDIILANIGILVSMMILCYFSFRNYKKEKKILYCLVAIYGLLSIILSIINISFVLYYNSQDDYQYFKNHPSLETLQNVNWYMFIIPLFLFFLIILMFDNLIFCLKLNSVINVIINVHYHPI